MSTVDTSNWGTEYRAYLAAFTAWRRAQQAFQQHMTCENLAALEAAEQAQRDTRLAYDQALLAAIYPSA